MTDEFVKLLDQGCADLGIELSDQQKEQFFKYYERAAFDENSLS